MARNSCLEICDVCFLAKIVDGAKVTEEKARHLFDDVKDASNVELAKFQEAIGKLANEQKKSIEDFSKTLAAEAPKFLEAAMAAATAAAAAAASTFKEALSGDVTGIHNKNNLKNLLN